MLLIWFFENPALTTSTSTKNSNVTNNNVQKTTGGAHVEIQLQIILEAFCRQHSTWIKHKQNSNVTVCVKQISFSFNYYFELPIVGTKSVATASSERWSLCYILKFVVFTNLLSLHCNLKPQDCILLLP